MSYSLAAFLTTENLILEGLAASTGTGNDLANRITGNLLGNDLRGAKGNDTLDGGAANDVMRGGLDDDTYILDSAGDVVVENAGAAEGLQDTVVAPFSINLAIFANVENATLVGGAGTAPGGRRYDARREWR